MIKTERLYITEFSLDMVEAVHLNSLDDDINPKSSQAAFLVLAASCRSIRVCVSARTVLHRYLMTSAAQMV